MTHDYIFIKDISFFTWNYFFKNGLFKGPEIKIYFVEKTLGQNTYILTYSSF